MNGKRHLLINSEIGAIIIIIGIASRITQHVFIVTPILFKQTWLDAPSILFAFVASFAWCDIDQYHDLLPHRNWFTHSIIICLPLIFVPLWWWQFPAGIFTFFVGCHLVSDCIKDPKKQKGYWNIAITKKKRMKRWQSLAWLEINGWLGIILGLVVMLL